MLTIYYIINQLQIPDYQQRNIVLLPFQCITDEECNDDISEDSFEIDSNLERHPLMSRMPRFYEIDHQVHNHIF